MNFTKDLVYARYSWTQQFSATSVSHMVLEKEASAQLQETLGVFDDKHDKQRVKQFRIPKFLPNFGEIFRDFDPHNGNP